MNLNIFVLTIYLLINLSYGSWLRGHRPTPEQYQNETIKYLYGYQETSNIDYNKCFTSETNNSTILYILN